MPQPERTSTASEIWPTEQELMAYLHGKPLDVPASATIFKPFQGFDPDPGWEERAKRREDDVRSWRSGSDRHGAIFELKWGPSTLAVPREPWSRSVTFRYKLGAGHTVAGTALHKKDGNEWVFLGFKVINVE